MALPATPASYLGLYANGVPGSYAAVTSFTKSTSVDPRLVMYFSGWFEKFSMSFAEAAAQHGAVPLIQINPAGISVAAISAGRYDDYLTAYAKAVRSYRLPVILSFGHEMNGTWYSWGYRHTSPKVFVAAWRHIVTLFRRAGDSNVTWLWTINAFAASHNEIPSPRAWWPGESYVTWVGIDGYYRKRSAQFETVFGPTIAAVRLLTKAPILIAETAAPRAVGQPATIDDLFAGVKKYELLGFVWFDNSADRNYVMTGAAKAAIRRGAGSYGKRTP
jgi:Glycosyl hydrolase family 26